jgi:hypothetical protein
MFNGTLTRWHRSRPVPLDCLRGRSHKGSANAPMRVRRFRLAALTPPVSSVRLQNRQERSLRGVRRVDVRWGPRFCSTAPVQDPPSPPPSDFDLGPPLSEMRAGPRCEGSGAQRKFSRRPGRAGGDIEEAAVDGEAVAFERSARAGNWVRRAAIATRDEPSRPQVGPTILFDRPPAGSPSPPPSDFDLGPATLWRRVQSRRVTGAAESDIHPVPTLGRTAHRCWLRTVEDGLGATLNRHPTMSTARRWSWAARFRTRPTRLRGAVVPCLLLHSSRNTG